MTQISRDLSIRFLVALLTFPLLGGCTGSTRHVTSTVDFLYPNSKEITVIPETPVLALPLRAGIAFVPSDTGSSYIADGSSYTVNIHHESKFYLTEARRMALMQEVANHFKQYEFIKDIEIIPSSDLTRGGSFANLDLIRANKAIDVIALLSFDQVQFTDEGVASIAYMTLVGTYLVPGEKNETSTLLDAAVYDIKSRKLLFRAPGISNIIHQSTPVNLTEQLRLDSNQGFESAAKDMIINLDKQLVLFREKTEGYKVIKR